MCQELKHPSQRSMVSALPAAGLTQELLQSFERCENLLDLITVESISPLVIEYKTSSFLDTWWWRLWDPKGMSVPKQFLCRRILFSSRTETSQLQGNTQHCCQVFLLLLLCLQHWGKDKMHVLHQSWGACSHCVIPHQWWGHQPSPGIKGQESISHSQIHLCPEPSAQVVVKSG